MKTFTIDNDNNITVFASAEEAAAASITPFDTFTSRQDLADLLASWPAERQVATFNSLPGVGPGVKRFQTSNVAATRIWERIRDLGEVAQPEPTATKPAAAKTTRPKAATKAKGRAQSAQRCDRQGEGDQEGHPGEDRAQSQESP